MEIIMIDETMSNEEVNAENKEKKDGFKIMQEALRETLGVEIDI